MNLWESLVGIALILIVGAKLYTAWKGKTGQTSTPHPATRDSSEANPIEATASDLNLAEGNTKSTEVWDEGYLILIALIVCGPLGLILLWKTDKWNSNTKMKLTIGYLAIVFLLVVIGFKAA